MPRVGMAVPNAARAILAAAVFLCAAANASAQADPPFLPSVPIPVSEPVIPPVLLNDVQTQRFESAQQWAREYAEWKAWFARWHNRWEPGWFSARERRQPPAPPIWLGQACAAPLDESGPLGEPCRAWREWQRGDLSPLLTEKVLQTRAEDEAPRKSIWWQHLHVDALWPMTQSGSSAFGVAGVHATIPLSDRVQVFIAPGMILMRLPSADGRQHWTAGTDWGFSYRMFDFRMPGLRRLSTLHANLARVWLLGQNAPTTSRDLYLAGFSITFKSRPNGSMRK